MCRYLQHTTTLALPLVLLAIHAITVVRAGEQEREVWYEGARRAIEARIRAATNSNGAGPGTGGGNTPPSAVARGVVLFVGDGMGMSTLTAARILSGQRHGNTGEEAQLAWDSFPAVALSRTYNMDAQVGESSACATALLCGVKANYETVGLDSSARFENCYSSFDAHVPSLINWAQGQGKSTGLVTTTRVTHATPAALYAHAASRYWEDDGKVPSASRPSCKDIARQLLEDEPGRNINVILGGGRRHFVPKVTLDPEEPDKEGRRLDGRNLIEEWSRNNRIRKVSSRYVSNKEQFDSVDPRQVNYLLGLFAYSHMDFDVDRNTNSTGDPSLTEMTLKALHILAKNPEGYFLFVEGGRIDHAHHYNNAYRALDETLALEKAVRAVMKEVDLTETLIVVTADHSHVLTLGGLATHRGNPILGSDSKVSDVDGQPYTTLLYSNGPGYTQPRNILRDAGKDSIQTAGVPRAWATHGGEDVPVFAIGPLASILFSGSIDQSYIPHAISYAACLAHQASRCSRDDNNSIGSNDTMNVPISCPSAEPNSAAISSDVMNDQARNPSTKSIASRPPSKPRQPLDDLLFALLLPCLVVNLQRVFHLPLSID
ncbi:PREDICTED: alkaline phosphatase-like isoform X1 [Polistes canadensis]|uniref:alkaline phosphatase-like isoform X1 n=1 Tax=Polistes canadensis TaxID=91411 RepID=UPI000718DD59|nr:PREDICTED: alkaline phosphatase-like isoform X1 [Polistes canadensis]